MARITRKNQKIFAGSASNNGQFGSAQAGTKVLSSDLDTLQALTAFVNGWNDATISSQKLPTLEEMQALHYITTTQLAYLFQEGIPEYNAATEYHQYSIVKKPSTYEIYGSKTNTNTGNALPSATDNTDWQYLGNLADIVNITGDDSFTTSYFHAQCQRATSTADGNATSGSFQDRLLNTEVTDSTNSGAELNTGTGVNTFETGTYIIRASCPAYQTDGHQSKLYNITDAADALLGTTTYAQTAMSGYTRSEIVGVLVVSGGPKTYKLQTRVQTSATNGHGTSIGWGTNIYSQFESWKIA